MQTALFDVWLEEAVREVLETMCFLPVEKSASPAQEEAGQLRRRVEFSGPFTGSFGLCTTPDGARLIACNLLGEEPSQVSPEQAGDTLGEIVNMICGSILCRAEAKQAFTLSHPVDGERGAAGAATAHRGLQSYAIEGSPLTTWLDIERG